MQLEFAKYPATSKNGYFQLTSLRYKVHDRNETFISKNFAAFTFLYLDHSDHSYQYYYYYTNAAAVRVNLLSSWFLRVSYILSTFYFSKASTLRNIEKQCIFFISFCSLRNVETFRERGCRSSSS